MNDERRMKIMIGKAGWSLSEVYQNNGAVHAGHQVYPADREDMFAKWAIGPIEVARILERLGLRVDVTVERP